jgi:hypothetical protein
MKMPMPIRSLLRSVVFSLCLVLLGGCSTVLSTVRVVERRDGVGSVASPPLSTCALVPTLESVPMGG